MKIGIFGGTFDPPHIGHLILAAEAMEQLQLAYILWVLTPFPPHKKNQAISPIEDRILMVQMAINGNENFILSRVDIERDPPHYAADTVFLLRQSYPEDDFYYLMGADSVNDLTIWHEPKRFASLCHGIGIMARRDEPINPDQLEHDIPDVNKKLYFLTTPIIEISGSEIRRRVGEGRPFRYFVPDKIYQYILNHKLYQD